MLDGLQKEHKVETGKLVSVSAAPEKARRQADLATADLAAAQQLLAAAETRQMQVEVALRAVSDQLRQRQVWEAVCCFHAISAVVRPSIPLAGHYLHRSG